MEMRQPSVIKMVDILNLKTVSKSITKVQGWSIIKSEQENATFWAFAIAVTLKTSRGH